jgi:membrane-associated phospholipid phosphatase
MSTAAAGSSPRVLGAVGAGLLVLSVLLGAWVFARGNAPFAPDAAWNTFLVGIDWPPLDALARFMNLAGGVLASSLVVPAVGIVLLLAVRRPWSALYFLAAVALSGLVVQVLKHVFGRARPEEILVISDYGSYPSGHVANAATLATVLIVLLPRAWTVVVGAAWVLVMAFSRTYLHAHWLSDTLGGALVGAGAALVCAGLLHRLLARDRRGTAATASADG